MSPGPQAPDPGSPDAGAPPTPPPLVLRTRLLWRIFYVLVALYGLLSGAHFLARVTPVAPLWIRLLPWIQIACGALLAYGAVRYGFARLILDDHGFRLKGPLSDAAVRWGAVTAWRRFPPKGGVAPNLFVVHGPENSRLWIPLIYEEAHLLEVGLAQRGFPRV